MRSKDRKQRDESWISHTWGATGGKTVTAHPQDRLYLLWHLGRASLPRLKHWDAPTNNTWQSLRRPCEGDGRQMRVNPGNPRACGGERIRMQHAERRTCRSGRLLLPLLLLPPLLLPLLLSASMTKHDLHLPKISELSVSARWWHACTRPAAASWHHWSISLLAFQ